MSRAYDWKQRYAPMALVGLLVLNLGLMGWTARSVSPEDGTEQMVLKTWTISLVSPVQRFFGWAFGGVGSVWNGYVDLRGVRERNESLELENAQLRSEIEAARVAAAENDRLRRELELKPRLKYQSVSAEIVSRETQAWFKVVTIDKGSIDGIRKNNPVVTPDGLVGRVVAVGPNASKIQLITDEHAGAGGRLVSSGAAGEIKGRGDGTCRFKNISSIEDVKDDEAILTSGLDRIYPAGILIGMVQPRNPNAGPGPQEIVVKPAAQLDRISEVMVLLVEPKDLSTPDIVK
jgi:rod shape-determining protein MreC